ncbi:MAG: sugar ABC transporter ATP-binding protein [Sphaerochaeta sp.]|nr:sugar ABC transporter ATP-binding protein [Sphaerochaeta sp.]
METPFLSMQKVSKHYAGVRALDEVDFTIREGEIHCLAGTNGSGKSTLVKIISGVVQPEKGCSITIAGKEVSHLSSRFSKQQGIEVIYQDLSLFPNLSVAENIVISEQVSGPSRIVSWKKGREKALQAMKMIGISLPLDCTVSELSMADQQLVAICRALTREVRLLIMDEPTTALTRKEIESLLKVVLDLKSKGIATLFISHKLNEIMEVAQRVSVLRDGKMIGCFSCKELSATKLEFAMTGANTTYDPYHVQPDSSQTPLVEIRQGAKEGNFKDINLCIYPGEIVGLTGLLGSGRTELALSLFGLNPLDAGQMYVEGKLAKIRNVQDAMDYSIAYVPENRLADGVALDQPISKNLVITVLDEMLGKLSTLDAKAVQNASQHWIDALGIKVPSMHSPVKTLSGGNQQRVVLAKWIATRPKLLILDNPTVGIDIAAKSSIHAVIKRLAEEGMSILMISDEIPEVLYSCNRVLIMNRGRIVKSFITDETTEDDIQSFIVTHAV